MASVGLHSASNSSGSDHKMALLKQLPIKLRTKGAKCLHVFGCVYSVKSLFNTGSIFSGIIL